MARIVVAGYVVRFPLAGQAWAHLQYVLGLQALGHEVTFAEDAGWRDACYDPERGTMGDDASYGLRFLADCMRRIAPDTPWVFRDAGGEYHGLSEAAARARIASADVLLNLSGVTWLDGFERIPARVFIDEDPLFTQVRATTDAEFAALLKEHQALYSYGHNIGQPGCEVPTAGLCWRPFRQPIALDKWQSQTDAPPGPFTTILSWNAYGEVHYGGRLFGAKSRSFPIVADVPRRTRQALELAASGDEVPAADLAAHGWALRDPLAVSQTLDSYRAYIQRSRGEFSIAKHAYVVSRCGWFSDRSAAYLASGRPVVLQDTGYGAWLPVGAGLLPFATGDEAVAAIDAVNADYARHSRAARAIAAEHFDAKRVLGRLLGQL